MVINHFKASTVWKRPLGMLHGENSTRYEDVEMFFLLVGLHYLDILLYQKKLYDIRIVTLHKMSLFSYLHIIDAFYSCLHLIIFLLLFSTHYYSCTVLHTFHPSTWCSSTALQIAAGIIFNTLHLHCSYLCSVILGWILILFVAVMTQLKFHLVMYLMEDYLDALFFLHAVWKIHH